MKLSGLFFLGLTSLWLGNVMAGAPATVEQVQPPAWLERAGVSMPALPGQAVNSGDQLRTGEGARVYLRLAEGSRVKLGEGAKMTLYSQSLAPEKKFSGAFDILQGAFRFTTDALARHRAERNLSIRVATATIGIRGTDVWGKAADDRDLVALIEGRISLTRAGETLDIAPMQYMDAVHGQGAQIKPLDQVTLDTLAAQTEIAPQAGVTTQRGSVALSVAMAGTQSEALGLYDRIRAAGFAVRIRPTPLAASSPVTWQYAVQIVGYHSHEAALAAATRLRRLTGIN